MISSKKWLIRFTAIGSDSEVLRCQKPDTRVVDLQGASALPGFVDKHVHFADAATLGEVDFTRVLGETWT
jgi:predicted amidohydrolase YtcJ